MTELITGNTYPVKEQIKALGGIWDRHAKGWRVPADRATEARAIVAGNGPALCGVPQGWRKPVRRSGSTYTRFSSGAEVYTNRNGRCEDAPCCGCCS